MLKLNPSFRALRSALRLFPLFCLLAGSAGARIVPVRDVDALAAAVRNAQPRDTVLLEEGVYALKQHIQIDGKQDLTIASRTGSAARTVIRGKGFASMDGNDDLIRIGSSKRVRIENLGFQECHGYGIKLEAEKNPEDISIRGCRFLQIGTRHIKGSASAGTRALRGEIVGCQFQNTSVPGADWQSGGNYVAAIDLMALDGWRIADNVFKDVKGRSGGGRAAIFVWVGSRNVTVERNLIMGCDRGIAFGNPSPSTNGADVHVSGSVCRNNFIVAGADAGIELAWVRDVGIMNNTIWRNDVDGRGIRSVEKLEGVSVVNNLVRGRIQLLGSEVARSNLAGALDGYFHSPQTGDLHIRASATSAIDKGVAVEGASEDIDGDRCPLGSAPDIGADEWRPVATGLDARHPETDPGFAEKRWDPLGRYRTPVSGRASAVPLLEMAPMRRQ